MRWCHYCNDTWDLEKAINPIREKYGQEIWKTGLKKKTLNKFKQKSRLMMTSSLPDHNNIVTLVKKVIQE